MIDSHCYIDLPELSILLLRDAINAVSIISSTVLIF